MTRMSLVLVPEGGSLWSDKAIAGLVGQKPRLNILLANSPDKVDLGGGTCHCEVVASERDGDRVIVTVETDAVEVPVEAFSR